MKSQVCKILHMRLWNHFYLMVVVSLLFCQKNLKMVFCYQNCSDLLWEKIVLVIKKNFWNCKIFEITRTIYSNSESSEQFLVTECLFNLFLEVFVKINIQFLTWISPNLSWHPTKVKTRNESLYRLSKRNIIILLSGLMKFFL